jgi:farnesyl-diphosphate farnesyltransferase
MPTLNELLHAASRTFAIGIDLLPEPLRAEVEVAYLLLRVSDYLEDNVSMEPRRKAQLLSLWAEVLRGGAPVDALEREVGEVREGGPDALVARNLRQVHRALLGLARADARRVIQQHVRDSTVGMARWTERGPSIADEADLDDYMHEVAGRVGWLLTELFALGIPQVARRKEEMMHLGREFGLGLQTVNVIRGLHSDWERGWVYIPRTFLEGSDVLASEIFRDPRSPELEAAVLARIARKAERHLAAARSYILSLPTRHHGVRLFCLLPYLFAVRTVTLSRGHLSVFREEVKVTRPEVRGIVRAARLLGWSNTWISWYARRLAVPARPRLAGGG